MHKLMQIFPSTAGPCKRSKLLGRFMGKGQGYGLRLRARGFGVEGCWVLGFRFKAKAAGVWGLRVSG